MSVDQLSAGREAYARRDWAGARDHLDRAGADELGAADLRLLSTAAYLLGDPDVATRALQRAHSLSVAEGDRLAAARDAHWVAHHLASRGEHAVAAGWVARAHRLLEGEPEGIPERGYLLIHEVFGHLGAGNVEGVLRCCERIREIGTASGDADLVAFGLTGSGRALIYSGRVPDGIARLDEGMVALTTGEVSPIMAGQLYCTMVEGCQEIGDYRRMVAWTDELTRWCQDQPDLVPFTAQCAVHRAQILRVHGAFAPALEELDRAVERYAAVGLPAAVGLALYERGEVLRTTGDLDAAEHAYDEAAEHGFDPQPGRSLLWLSRGRVPAAVGCAHRLVEEAGGPVARARVLGPVVAILLAGAETDAAEAAAVELQAIAQDFACESVVASAGYASGLVALAQGDPRSALLHLRRAWRCAIEVGARLDAARARVGIARAMRALGDDVSATSELNVALRTLTELGATPARREVEQLLGSALPDGLTAREVEVLGLVAAGRSNPQIARELVLSEKTVARHLSNIFTKVGVTSRTAAAAYAFEHGLV